jgi:prophage maintenance system killer protein
MEYITVTEIIEIHDEIIKKYGGPEGLETRGHCNYLFIK